MNTTRSPELHLLQEMVRIRRFEEKCAELYSAGKIRGFLHLYIGEEAVAVGAMQSFSREDSVFATYREHGHALARGISARAIMAEMYGKYEGCSHGRGGSMHLFDASARFYGGSAIVGGALPLAMGCALADKLRKRDAITACFFGEGAVAEGVFHESLNLASLWKVPVLFLCENNLYAMGTALERSEADTDLCEKARSYKVPSRSVDGMNVIEVRDATAEAAARVRAGEGPQFVEFRTYRFRAHSMFDAELYRSKAEVALWKDRCPIKLYRNLLERSGLLDEAELERIESEVEAEIADCVAYAEAGTWEPVANLTLDVYTAKAA
jgi:pyruvate dehydrogenase E1 component alpha subunit